jgi:hypothetical protein
VLPRRTVGRMATATIRDVELVSTGTWSASTGVTRIERGDLESILAAAADPDVDAAPIKLGHIDPRFDGEPAAGWVRPTRIVDRDGRSTLLGDFVGMPARLAELAPTAYRRRSVEIIWSAKTAKGRAYRAVLTGIALLGVAAPAVKGLADVMALFRGEHPLEGEQRDLRVVAGLENNAAAVALLAAVSEDLASDRVEELARLAGAADTANVPPPIADPPNDGPQNHDPAAGDGGTMPVTEDRVREILNLEADADVEATLRRLATAGGDGEDPTEEEAAPTGQPPGEETATPPVGDPAVPADAPAPTEDVAPQLVTLSAGNLAQLQADAAAGAAAAAQLAEQRRQGLLDGAVRSGRIAPGERSLFAAQLARDEEGTTTLLSSLAPRFAVSELGADHAPVADQAADAAWDAWEQSTFSDLAAQ